MSLTSQGLSHGPTQSPATCCLLSGGREEAAGRRRSVEAGLGVGWPPKSHARRTGLTLPQGVGVEE